MKLPKFLNFWKRRHQAVCSSVLTNFPTAATKENPTRRSVQKVFGDKNEASVGQPAAASIANETAPASISAAPSCPWYTLCHFTFFLSCAFLLSAWSLNHKSLPWLGLAWLADILAVSTGVRSVVLLDYLPYNPPFLRQFCDLLQHLSQVVNSRTSLRFRDSLCPFPRRRIRA